MNTQEADQYIQRMSHLYMYIHMRKVVKNTHIYT